MMVDKGAEKLGSSKTLASSIPLDAHEAFDNLKAAVDARFRLTAFGGVENMGDALIRARELQTAAEENFLQAAREGKIAHTLLLDALLNPGLPRQTHDEQNYKFFYETWATAFAMQLAHIFLEKTEELNVNLNERFPEKRNKAYRERSAKASEHWKCLIYICDSLAPEADEEVLIVKHPQRILEVTSILERMTLHVIARTSPSDAEGVKDSLQAYRLSGFRLVSLYEYGSESIAATLRDLFLRNSSNNGLFGPAFEKLARASLMDLPIQYGKLAEKRKARAIELFKPIIQKINNNWKDVLRLWIGDISATDYQNHSEMIHSNLMQIKELESLEPGSAGVLAKEFGILEFGRYPLQLLRRQYAERDSAKPYGLVIFPQADHNGVYHNTGQLLLPLLIKLKQFGIELRVIEIGDNDSLVERTISLRRRYERKAGKAKFGVWGGHGTVNTMQWGNAGEGSRLKKEHTKTRQAQFIADAFAPGAPHALIACATGAEDGLAQDLSETFQTTIDAPDVSVFPRGLYIDKNKDGSLEITTVQEDVNDSKRNAARRYVNGKLVTKY